MMSQNNPQPVDRPRHEHRPGFFWPILLIGGGLILLLSNLGVLPQASWGWLWQLWPVILIAIGLDILFGRRSVWGQLAGAILALLVVGGVVVFLVVAQSNPALLNSSPFFSASNLITEQVSQPLGTIHTATVEIHYPSGTGSLKALSNSPDLMEGEVTHSGNLINTMTTSGDSAHLTLSSQSNDGGPFFDFGQQRWNFSLNPSVTYDLQLEQGSGSTTFDLGQFNLHALSLDMGSGDSRVNLPAAGQYTFRLQLGSGSVNVQAPQGVSVQVKYQIGSGSLRTPGLQRVSGDQREGVYQSANYSQGGPYVNIDLQMGSGSVTVR
jgi:hypothetical protein